jgi:lysozyme
MTTTERFQGIDIAYPQRGAIDWQKVREAGFGFAFIKRTEGNGGIDPAYTEHVKGARSVGMPIGPYHFARPSEHDQDAARELELLYGACDGLGTQPGDLPPVLDLETTQLSGPATLRWIETWIWLAYKYWNRWPVLYTGSYFYEALGKEAAVAEWATNCPLWIAQYTIDYRKDPARARTYEPSSTAKPRVPKPWKSWDLWQYSGNGGKPVPGVRVDCDRNVFNGTREEFYTRFVLPEPSAA